MSFHWKPTRWHLFVIDFKSKKHQRIYVYLEPRGGIYFGNNWGGQLANPIWGGLSWRYFFKHGIRLSYCNSLSRKSRMRRVDWMALVLLALFIARAAYYFLVEKNL